VGRRKSFSKKFHSSRFLILLSFILILLAALVGFQNCGNVLISKVQKFPSLSMRAKSPVTYVNPPVSEARILRLALFIDMSRSMISGPCDDDVDGTQLPPEKKSDAKCHFEQASDINMSRLNAAENWIHDIVTNLPPAVLGNLKVAIVPFTGGFVETQRVLLGADTRMDFGAPSDALDYLEKLKKQQAEQIQFSQKGPFVNEDKELVNQVLWMGTSVPHNRMVTLETEISNELEQLKNQGLSGSSSFQIAFISDGIPSPTKKDAKTLIDIIWNFKTVALGPGKGVRDYKECPKACDALVDEALSAGANGWPAVGQYGYCDALKAESTVEGCPSYCLCVLYDYTNNGITAYTRQNQSLLNDMNAEFGDFQLNNTDRIMADVARIKRLFLTYSEAEYKFHFFYVNKSEPRKFANPVENWIKLAEAYFPKNAVHEELTSDKQEHHFFPQLTSSASYELRDLFALNLTARVDVDGVLKADSDGDGLFDYQEGPASRTTARSNGYCLDSITKKWGCLKAGCNPKLDLDGDWLNECEEKTVGTDPNDFDTDGDSIPDVIEVIYGLDPKTSAKKSFSSPVNNDGLSDFDHFKMGIPPFINPALVPAQFRTVLKKDFQGYAQRTVNGKTVSVPGYIVHLDNLPLINTLGAKDFALGGSLKPGDNYILFLGYVNNTANSGDGYWIYQTKIVNVKGAPLVTEVDLGEFKQLKVKDPQGSSK